MGGGRPETGPAEFVKGTGMRMMKYLLCLCVTVAGLGLTSQAEASTDYDFQATLVQNWSDTIDDSNVYTGRYWFEVAQKYPGGQLPDPRFDSVKGNEKADGDYFYAHCIEQGVEIHGGKTYDFQVVDLDDAPLPSPTFTPDAVEKLQTLWAIEFNTNEATGAYLFMDELTGASRFAAAQKAIWTVTDGIKLNSETVDDMDDMDDNAQKFLDEMNAFLDLTTDDPINNDYTTSGNLQAMVNEGTQDFIGLFEQASTTATPLPAAAWGGLMLLGSMGGFRLFRRRRAD